MYSLTTVPPAGLNKLLHFLLKKSHIQIFYNIAMSVKQPEPHLMIQIRFRYSKPDWFSKFNVQYI